MEVAPHLACNMPKYEQSLISQLRLGILPLRIEKGRYSNSQEADHTCLICETNAIENEEHFLFDCNFYSLERSKLETDIGCTFNDMPTEMRFNTGSSHVRHMFEVSWNSSPGTFASIVTGPGLPDYPARKMYIY